MTIRNFASTEPLDADALRSARLRTLPRPSRHGAPLSELRGVGPKLAAAASRIGIETLGDMVRHVPRDYRDAAKPTAVNALIPGEETTVACVVRSAKLRPTRRRGLTLVEAIVADESGQMKAVWFNQPWLAEKLVADTPLLIRGILDNRSFRVAGYEFPQLGDGGEADLRRSGCTSLPRAGQPPAGIHTTGVIAVHPAGEGVRPQQLREWAWRSLPLAPDLPEALPSRLRVAKRLAGVADAHCCAHFPKGVVDAETARRRIAFDELLVHQTALALRRRGRENGRPGVTIDPSGELTAGWVAGLPFALTGDQRRACAEIDADLAAGRPMQRLLMGEVGSGKTVVALYAMLRALESNAQAALMAPTETLAEQHFRTLESLLADASVPVPATLLTGSTAAARRRDTRAKLASGELGLVVGTHALISEGVEFSRLAVAVIDEQHRFGVRQRAALDARGPGGAAPHALHMTATPIPRTLSLTAYGDLDTTTLRELPAGRRPIKTWVVGEEKRAGAYEFLRERLREGRQAYVICPLVSETDELGVRAATEEAQRLAAGELAGFSVAAMHGQMAAGQRGEVMARFKDGELDVLVATTVVEVGVDVPNAAVMVIEEADRYGLSQLHQLRGRIGRGEHASACILFADPEGERARMRLDAIAAGKDGFELAEVDLAVRGEGEVLGTRQHGLPQFRVATLPEDAGLLIEARELVAGWARGNELESELLAPLVAEARARYGDERAERIRA